MTKAVHTRK